MSDLPPGGASFPTEASPVQAGAASPPPKKKDSAIVETLRTILYALLIAFVERTFGYEPFNIPSRSMVPTLLVGDYLFVAKFAYGYSNIGSFGGFAPVTGRVFGQEPKRGDVVVFKLPRDNATDYIKRVVGMPGERIQMKEGRLYINGEQVPRQRVEDYVETIGKAEMRWTQYIETLPGGVKYRIIEIKGDDGELDNTLEFTVPSGHYFMMGDNRDDSQDSRAPGIADRARPPVGYVPYVNLVGRSDMIFFSVDEDVRLWEIWKWPIAIRYGRLGDIIE